MRVLGTCVVALSILVATGAMAAGTNDKDAASSASATASSAPTTAKSAAAPATAESKIEAELEQLRDLLEVQAKQLQEQGEELKAQREKTAALEQQLKSTTVPFPALPSFASTPPSAARDAAGISPVLTPTAPSAAGANTVASNASSMNPPQASDSSKANSWDKMYNGGFFVESPDKNFSLYLNGLFQPRFTEFDANGAAVALGAPPTNVSNFDIFLGRLALSGSVFDPSVRYFVQFQGSTSGNTNGTNFIDWFAQKQFSKALSVQMGRSWTPFSLENLDSPGQYLFPDFSSAEYAFALSRAVGFEALGQAGKLGYAVMIANSVPGLDAPGQLNFNNKLAYIGHVQYDVLAPYGYQETDPSPSGAPATELTLWTSVGYNPVATSSAFSNQSAGDSTVNVNQTVAFRKEYFTLQNTGFYRDTKRPTLPSFNSYGYAEQAGYYIVGGRFEVDARIAGVNWGAEDFTGVTPGEDTNTWYSGPNFPFHRVTEHSFGFNYYLHGHNAKLQTAYSYLSGNTFSAKGFAANRIWIQAQVMF
jgi:hypothetical protein